ncbi:hypothetical protein NC653_036423 [Populus alba x Populus x berolinensis]|uniref:Uncharacterized protein n=2 Tax=Populus TaxID=3689 RepID=A0A4U5N9L9_POPAL|nr:hypothetical protein NC653_036423 [Populus alba x Populus x berolinensis]TKR79588.1 hypothetical protein D5086_0000270690 [Populus alba]
MAKRGNDSPNTIDGWTHSQGRREEANYSGEKLLTAEEPVDAGLRNTVGSPVGAYSLLELLELLCCCWLELAHGYWCERELLNIASMEAGIVHDSRGAPAIAAPSVAVSFMAETGDHNGDAEDFVDVALVHHAGAELLL